jgi:hypothetical protein
VSFEVDPFSATGPEKITSLQSRSDAGNTIQTDILPFYILRADPQGVSGNVTVTVFTSGGGGPFSNTFFADAASLPNSVADEVFHKLIADWINSVLTGNPARVGVVGNAAHESEVPGDLNGFYVRLPVGSSVTDISIGGQMGQKTVSETMRNPQSAIPTVSEWGLILLIAMLVLSALWMLQRRRADGSMTA